MKNICAWVLCLFTLLFLFSCASQKETPEQRLVAGQKEALPDEMKEAETAATETESEDDGMTLGQAIASGKELECIYPPGRKEESVTWIKEGKVKSEWLFGEIKNHALSVGNCFTAWMENAPAPVAVKTCYETISNVARDQRTGEDKNRIVDCTEKNVSESVFVVPGIAFNEIFVPAGVELH